MYHFISALKSLILPISQRKNLWSLLLFVCCALPLTPVAGQEATKLRRVSDPTWRNVIPTAGGQIIVAVSDNPWDRKPKWGIVDRSGKVVVAPKWDRITDTPDGFVVSKSGRVGFLNLLGETVLKPEWTDIQPLSGELFAVSKNAESVTLVNSKGQQLTKQWFQAIRQLSDSTFVTSNEGKHRIIDNTGRDLFGESWDIVGEPSHGLVVVGNQYNARFTLAGMILPTRELGLVSLKGKTVVPARFRNLAILGPDQIWVGSLPKMVASDLNRKAKSASGLENAIWTPENVFKLEGGYSAVSPFINSLAVVQRADDNRKELFGIIDEKGNEIIECKWEHLGNSSSNFPIRATGNGKSVFFRRDGKQLTKNEWNHASDFKHGVAVVGNDKATLMNALGKIQFQPKFDSIHLLSPKLAKAKVSDRWHLISYDGKFVTPKSFDEIGKFSCGLAPVKRASRFGYANEQGDLVVACRFDYAGDFVGDLAVVAVTKSNDLISFGIIDRNGKLVVELENDRIAAFTHGVAPFRLIDEVGFYTKSD